ncbi:MULTISPECIES: hypothetical protein [unclassified Nitrosomonas]|uniref:hypothetical protein n=1 Tax=unclassified Nitrosomonas TaxID=2609265 RepID=UPI001FC8BE17|nr:MULTISPECIES: hypothetical protein [unclassified Nitrosomonas]
MRLLILLLSSMFFVGCAAPIVKVDIPNIKESDAANVADLRPASEKENKIFSLAITSEAYGTYRRGDARLNPPVTRILQHRAYEKFNATGEIPKIKIHHLVVYANLKSELRRDVTGGFLGGLIGAGIASATQKNVVDGIASVMSEEEFRSLGDEEYKRTLYTEKENPNKASVFIVYLDAEVNGKRTVVKTMTPTKLADGKNPHLAAVETAIAYFLQQY